MDGQLENTFHSFPEHGLTIVKTARVAETKHKECRASIVAVEEGIRLLKTSRSKIGTDVANAPVDLLREACETAYSAVRIFKTITEEVASRLRGCYCDLTVSSDFIRGVQDSLADLVLSAVVNAHVALIGLCLKWLAQFGSVLGSSKKEEATSLFCLNKPVDGIINN